MASRSLFLIASLPVLMSLGCRGGPERTAKESPLSPSWSKSAAKEATPTFRGPHVPARPSESAPPAPEAVMPTSGDQSGASLLPPSPPPPGTAAVLESNPSPPPPEPPSPPELDSHLSPPLITPPPVQKKKEPVAPPPGAAGNYGHARDYSWLQGKIDRPYTGGIKLRFCDPGQEEACGGSVFLLIDGRAEELLSGMIVLVEGRMSGEANHGQRAPAPVSNPTYRVSRLTIVRPDR